MCSWSPTFLSLLPLNSLTQSFGSRARTRDNTSHEVQTISLYCLDLRIEALFDRFPRHVEVQGSSRIPSVLYYDANGYVSPVGSETNRQEIYETAVDLRWTKTEWFGSKSIYLFLTELLAGLRIILALKAVK